MENPHDKGIVHWEHEPKHLGRAALPRRPNFSRNEHGDVPVPVRDEDRFVARWNARDGVVGCAAAHPHREDEGNGSWKEVFAKCMPRRK